jgi:uncharacterized membrane protein YdjX (TVP38/TMEM64 family)
MNTRRVLALVAFPALVVALIAAAVVFRQPLWQLFRSTEALRESLRAAGAVAPLVFMCLQALQVVVFVIPGEIPQVVGGYLFGIWKGTLLSLAGITLGAGLNFLISRLLGLPFVYALFRRDSVDKIRRLADSRRARLSFFLLFLIPGIPKDVLCYVAGLSPLGLMTFLLFSTLGRIPGIVGSALIGDAAAGRRWLLAAGVFITATVLFVVGFLFRERIQQLLERMARGVSRGRSGRSRAERGKQSP